MADSSFAMVDVGEKTASRRRAVATGTIEVGPDTFALIRDGALPKGDALKLAEVAGILAAKKTSEMIPLCHPLALDHVSVRFELDAARSRIQVWCEAVTTAKTGVEMEALSGVTGALLAIYDLAKMVNPALWISEIHLETKEGGKSGDWRHPRAETRQTDPAAAQARPAGHGLEPLTFGIVTVSDRCSRGEARDRSGPTIREVLEAQGGRVLAAHLVPDEMDRIGEAVRQLAMELHCDVVVTTGGTGLGPRDVTPEALEKIASRVIPGLGELLRSRGAAKTPMSWISRSVAVQVGSSLVIALPGSEKAVREGLEAVLPLMAHSHAMVRGGGH